MGEPRSRAIAAVALLVARAPLGAPCDDLAALALPDTTITAASHVAARGYCRVEGVVAPSVRFEVHLPDAWNGKFQGVGNGALAGTLNAFGLANGVARGYATASTDTVHAGSPIDGRWALGRPDLVEDFGHRGIHVMTLAAKAISDPAITPLGSIDYWERVVRAMRGRRRTDAFMRLFLVPGMQHCAGGRGPSVFDGLGALERWVEEGVAPDRIVAAHQLGGGVARTRPLCPHPRVARWDGAGSTDDAASFRCARR